MYTRMVIALLLTVSYASTIISIPAYGADGETKAERVNFVTVVLAPRRRAIISAEVGAKVSKITRELGESFVIDQPLVILDDTLYERQLKKAEALLSQAKANLAATRHLQKSGVDLRKAEADLTVAKANYEVTSMLYSQGVHTIKAKAVLEVADKNLNATEKLFEDNAASEMDLANARKDMIVAKANLAITEAGRTPDIESAKNAVVAAEANLANVKSGLEPKLQSAEKDLAVSQANVDIAREELSACTIMAPFTGRVVKVMINEHELVQRGTKLVEIVNDEVLLAKFLMSSKAFGSVKLGQSMPIEIAETGTKEKAVISHISAVIDPASETFEVFAEIKNTSGRLRSGMRGQLQLSKIGKE